MFTQIAAGTAFLALAGAIPQVVDVKPVGPVINVTPSQKFQVYDGTLVSEAFQRGKEIYLLDNKQRDLTLDLLFSNVTGAGFTILRNGIGSAQVAPWDQMPSIEPNDPGLNYSTPHYLTLAQINGDDKQLQLAKDAIARGVHTVYADAWSADYYMKNNSNQNYGGFLCGVTGTNCATGDWRQAYANKLVHYIQEYANNGVTIDYVGFLNEPDENVSYASMLSNGQQAADFIPILFDTIKAAGLPTQVACCDNDGWEAQRGLLPGIQAAGAEQYLGIVTSHGYSSPPGTPFNTTKRVWETEWSTFDGLNYAWYNYGGQSEGLTWANHVLSGYGMSNISAMGYWWGPKLYFSINGTEHFLDEAANNTDNEALIYVNSSTNVVTPTKRLWAFAHFGSRLVQAGAYRVGATISGGNATTSLNTTAFANADGSIAVQVINNSQQNETLTLEGTPFGNGYVETYLTNNNVDFSMGHPISQDKGRIVANIPGKSLLSFLVVPS